MPTRNRKRLETINKKIEELQKAKSKLEDSFIQDMSKHLAKVLLKKRAYNFDKSILLKKIESVIDATNITNV